jgi:uncharacterized protein with PIN domain
MNWTQSLKRVFNIDAESCPECSGELRGVTCIESRC